MVVFGVAVRVGGSLGRLVFAVSVNRRWAREIMKPAIWEILAGMPYQPLLGNCFRRAASYCYREMDVPSPYGNLLFHSVMLPN
jgi:hypothetical protein